MSDERDDADEAADAIVLSEFWPAAEKLRYRDGFRAGWRACAKANQQAEDEAHYAERERLEHDPEW